MSRTRFETLDGLRGVAAACVLTFHMGYVVRQPLIPLGYLAVDFFFLLSGFVLADAYGEKLECGFGPGRFLRLRLARLYPLYAIGLAVGIMHFVLVARHGGITTTSAIAGIAANVLMLPGYISGVQHLYPMNAPAWSLFFELVINVVYAIVAPQLSTRKLAAVVVTAAAALGCTWYFTGTLDLGPRWSDLWGGFIRVAFSFFAGVLLYRAHRADRAARRGGEPRRGEPFYTNIAIIAIFGALAGTLALANHSTELALALVAFPAVVWVAAKLQPTGALRGLCLTGGTLSYAVYAIHVPILDTLGPKTMAAFPSIAAIALALAVIAAAYGAERLWDVPLRKHLVRAS
jgi:peptidoglycan/LPS O-acetylase OafA/YrhL